ncbi:AfsR/SARP family transcriptional regulator [Streptomyces sp. NPDC020875]|uniref:AfsR/SARP family transcriptional regulator n=1 Tax=Streptomyces sp. NPDC020875 TaxID=3154898 RepID=UPI0033FAE859
MLRIDLLGNLLTTYGGETVTPSAPKIRQVLALLALRSNTAIPHRRFVEELWGDSPPPSATTTLQTYICHLRKIPGMAPSSRAPAPADGPELRTTPGGYQLRVPPGTVDVRRFDELADAGQRAMEDGEVEQAADALHRALGLSRGPVLGDVTRGPVVTIDVLHLEERRYEILEQRIAADLLLGRHHRLVSELSALGADNPTRESLHGKLMLALYRTGRRPEALDTFRRLRHVLARDLGVEPCSELQLLHQRILAGAPELDLPHQEAGTVRGPQPGPGTPVPRGAASVPLTLPAAVPLLGRAAADTSAVRTLTTPPEKGHPYDRPRLITVAGPPGVGVTSFGASVAHRVKASYPDGCFYVSFGRDPRKPRSQEEVVGELLAAAGLAPAAPRGRAGGLPGLFRSWTAGRKVLLVLDDVGSAAQITDLLPADSGSAAMITGHRRLHGMKGQHTIDLGPLDPGDAETLLRHALGRAGTTEDRTGLLELTDLTGGVPGPLVEAVNLLTLRPHWSVRQLTGWLRQHPRGAYGGERGAFGSAARWVGGVEDRLRNPLIRLAELPGEHITAEDAAAALRHGFDQTVELLEELVEHFLLDAEMTTRDISSWFFRYRLPPSIRFAVSGLRDRVDAEPSPYCEQR